MAELERHGDVFLLDMGEGEKRFNPTFIARLNELLDEVEAAEGPHALVTTGTGKFFSNGLDLDWMMAGESDDPMAFVGDIMRMWARVLALPMPTVAAINGHAFAGGAMFSLAHDHILMRADRGYWCVNEVLLELRLAPGMQAILSARLTEATARKAILTAHRFDAPSALAASIADEIHPEDALRPSAIELAQSLAHTARPILGVLKEDLYADVLATLRNGASPDPF